MMILITGGAANGKSTYAESVIAPLSCPKYYIAAMRPYGEESAKKIARHRGMRAGKGFTTIEKYTHVWEAAEEIEEGSAVLLECLCNLTANEMFDPDGSEDAERAVMKAIYRLKDRAKTLVVITNDIGSDGSGYKSTTLRYVDSLGRINIMAAAMADVVIEMCAGIPVFLKGSL